jgi:hypothetical protein
VVRPKTHPDPQTADPLSEPTPPRRLWSAYLRKGWNRKQWARKLGVQYSTAFNWDVKGATPDLKPFVRMCELVGYSPDEILFGQGGCPWRLKRTHTGEEADEQPSQHAELSLRLAKVESVVASFTSKRRKRATKTRE